jgi:hypothetical protein
MASRFLSKPNLDFISVLQQTMTPMARPLIITFRELFLLFGGIPGVFLSFAAVSAGLIVFITVFGASFFVYLLSMINLFRCGSMPCGRKKSRSKGWGKAIFAPGFIV